MSTFSRFLNLWRPRSVDRDVADELRFHLEMRTEKHRRAGMDARKAAVEAERHFGGVLRATEGIREARVMVWPEHVWSDIVHARRTFARNPGFTFVAVFILALAIGATTAIFSVVHAVLLRPLPYADPERLVAIWDAPATDKTAKLLATYGDLVHWQAHGRSFAALAAVTWATGDSILTGVGPPQSVLAIPSTVGLFSLLGVSPALGRTFSEQDLARECSVVLAHAFWQTTLGGDPTIVGRELGLNEESCTVLGVMPAGFAFFPKPTALWTLMTPSSQIVRNPSRSGVAIVGRLKDGIPKNSAQAELSVLAEQIDGGRRYGSDMEPVVYSLHEEFTWLAGRNLQTSVTVLFAAVACVLLIACVNVANLLLGRSFVRQREMTIRSAIGSSRGRLVMQLLTESLLLSLSAAAIGTLLAMAAVRYFNALDPIQLPPTSAVAVNLPVLLFTACLAVITTVAFGLLPAWKGSRVTLNDALKISGRGQSLGRHRLAKGLVAAEMVLSLVLLAGAGLLIQSVARFAAAPVGFQAAGLVRYHMALPPRANPEQRARFYRQLLEDLGARSDVSVALSTDVPLRGDGGSNVLEVQGRVAPNAQTAVRDITQQSVSAGYFRVMGIPLQRGRAFIAADSLQTPTVCIINQTLARKYFPDADPIGHQIRFLGQPDATNPWLTIVGVAGDEKRASVYQEMGWSDASIAYRPLRAAPAANLLVRPATPRITLGTQVRQRVVELDPNVRIGEAETVEHTISEYLKYPRFRALLLGAFAALALLLAVVGLYGVLSQIVAQRTQEIGLRMALGAPHAQVVAAIVKEGMSLAVVGVALGAVLVAFLSRLISSLLYGVVSNDPVTIGGVSLLLLSAAALASYLPASQAAGIDPMIALRNE